MLGENVLVTTLFLKTSKLAVPAIYISQLPIGVLSLIVIVIIAEFPAPEAFFIS